MQPEDNTNPTDSAGSKSATDINAPTPSTTNPQPVTNMAESGSGKPSRFGSKKAKLAGIIVAAIVLLGAVGAGAYYGVYLPNTPNNVLKSSISNLLKQNQVSGKGSASFSGKDSIAGNINYDLKADMEKGTSAMVVEASFSGVKLPLEVRAVDKNLYVKVGDLDTIKSLAAGALGPETGSVVDEISKEVSNKWTEIDSSLIKTMTGQDKCSVLFENNRLSSADINKILKIYGKNQFVVVKSSTPDTVDGRKVVKQELSVDQEKGKSFAKELDSVEYFKKLNECSDTTGGDKEINKAEDFKGKYELTTWVDKGKKDLVKIALKVTENDTTATLDFTFNHDKVDVQKPQGAVPAMQVVGNLMHLFGGGDVNELGSGLPL